MNNKPGRSPKPASGKPVASKSGGAAAAARTAPAQDAEFAFLHLLPSAAVALELPNFKILAANAAAARLCGAPLGTNWLALLAEDDRPPFQRWSAAAELPRRSFDLAAGNAVDAMAARVDRGRGAGLLLLLSDTSAERASEQALRFSEERFRRAYERNLAGIYRTTLEGKFLDCNPALARMFGFASAAEMMKANAISLYFKEEDRRRVLEQAADQRPRGFEMLMRRIDGSPIWVLENVVAVEERPGTRPVLYGTVIEITERKLAEEMLRASEAYNRELVEGASDIIYTQDLNGNFTWANEAALRLTGYSLEEVRQKNMKDVVAQEYWEVAARHRLEKLEERASNTPYEVELVTKGGERLLLEVNTRLILRDGAPVGVQGIARDVTARRRAEVALRDSENKFRAVADTAPCAILIYNEKQFLYVNTASESVTGYSRQELLGMGVWDVVHPDHREIVQERGLARLRGDKVAQRYEFKLRHKSGETRWVDFAAGSIEYDGGTAAVGTAVDITERKRAERLQAALYLIAEKATGAEDLEKFYVAIHEIVGELLYARNFYIALLTPEGDALRFVYAADEADDTYPVEAVPLGKGCTEFVLRTGRPQLIREERFAELCAAGEIEQVGAPSVDWLGVPLKSGNRVYGVLAVQSYDARVRFEARDQEILTFVSQHVAAAIERKRNLDALRESEARYRSLVDSAVYGIFRSTRGGKFVSVNPALVKILGYESPEELLALDLAADVYVDAADRERVVTGLSKGESGAVEVRWKRKDRTTITVRLSGRRTETQRGETFEMIAEDVTERRGLEDQLRQSQKMEAVGRLAGGLAHDFNNLLTVIKGYSELMGNELDAKDPMRAEVTEIHRAAERAAGLTRQLLAFSRQQVLAPRVLDLNQVVANLQKMLGRLLGEDVDLYTALHPSLGRVKADPGQIEQVIMNLAVNARDAMPNGGKLTVETGNAVLDEAYAREHMGCKPGNYVMLAVADTGEGMSPETQGRIFEPFFTTKELGKGTGLGLSTVYGIIKQSEGYIWVYSELGIGTTFKIYLPRVDGHAEPTMTGKIPAYASYRGTETILLVEDEDGVRALIKQVLHRNGYTVLEARHGGEALLICERHPTTIHMLLTDVVLEQMSGRELAGRLATERPEMKVLFMSGYTDDAIVHHGVLDAKTAFLQKPFTTEALSRKVRGVLDGVPEE